MHDVKVYSLAKEGAKKIRPNFRVREFKSDGDAVFVSDELLDVLQDLRDHVKMPVNITSGFRSSVHNARVGGAKYSQHMYGFGVDLNVTGWSAKSVFEYLDATYSDKYGIGLYSNYVHIDVRPEKVRWLN